MTRLRSVSYAGHDPFSLIDRPLLAAPAAGTILKMAADLRAAGAIGSERDAIRALIGRYRYGEVVLYAEDARVETQRQIVAEQMARR